MAQRDAYREALTTCFLLVRWAHSTLPMISYGDQPRYPDLPPGDVRLVTQVVVELFGSPDVRARFDDFVGCFDQFTRSVQRIRHDEHSDDSLRLRAELPKRSQAMEDAARELASAMRADVQPSPP